MGRRDGSDSSIQLSSTLSLHSLTGSRSKGTTNLYAALWRLRLPAEPRMLWVDAMCISQVDMEEKAQQVGIMQTIYANAHQVLIWLGEEEESDRLAFRSLGRLSYYLDKLDNTEGHSIEADGVGWYRTADNKTFSKGTTSMLLEGTIEYDHLVKLLTKGWFHRTWVVQEVASAERAILMCGAMEMPWDIFANVFMRLRDHSLTVNKLEDGDTQHARENIIAMERSRRSRNGPMTNSLFHILLATCYSKCSDQRDTIFAVLGLAKDWLEKGGLIPKYTNAVTVEDVFKEFAVWDAKRNGKLRTLSCPSEPRAADGSSLPSWVPDWRNIENAHPFVRYGDRTGFSVSRAMETNAWHSYDCTIFNVMGKVVDSVFVLGSIPKYAKATSLFQIDHGNVERLKEAQGWLAECQNIAEVENCELATEKWERFWRTMTCGLTMDGFPAPSEYSGFFMKYLDFMNEVPELYTKYLREIEGAPIEVRSLDEQIPDFKTYVLIEASLYKWSSQRRFCTTKNGQLACVPRGAKVGDVICILFGGEVPYVLRPTGGNYTVVGECYVNGIMHGEALSNGNIKTKQFRLE